MENFTNNHRYFIQFMLNKGITTVANALEYCKYVSKGKIENDTQLKKLITEINRQITKQQFKLLFVSCEVTNRNMLVWINTRNDDISRLQTKYSAKELEYFHAILQEILHNEEHRLTFIVCINITSTLTSSFSRENGQNILKQLIKTGYFVRKGPYIYLGPRLIQEFTSYLKTHMPDSICGLCSELVFWGKSCACCHKTMHTFCLFKYLETQNVCPNCHNHWTIPMEEEEDDETNTEEDHSISYSQLQSSKNFNSQSVINNETIRNKSGHKRNEDMSSEEDLDVPGPSTGKRYRLIK